MTGPKAHQGIYNANMENDKAVLHREVCQEARVVLTSLRNGPPTISQGDLTRDLVTLRDSIRANAVVDLARPFLNVIMHPSAAGPHTLVSLRSIHRLLVLNKLEQNAPGDLCVCVLACKFEQTDAGVDEAVEMAIADVLKVLVQRHLPTNVLMDAFNTVFVTRNTFVSSPALCYHFEDVLLNMVDHVFTSGGAAFEVLEFLVHQLLHTPYQNADEEDSNHDSVRALCLKLIRTAIPKLSLDDPKVLAIVQDELCLSLLMTGQAVWDLSGLLNLEVLHEICSTIEALWQHAELRKHLIPQFETIWTGFYERALVMLRQRKSNNFLFDLELQVILESLLDLMALHDHDNGNLQDSGTLETLFWFYDCHLHRADVAMQLCLELSRCCGGTVNDEGEAMIRERTDSSLSEDGEVLNVVEYMFVQVPPRFKELCAQALAGAMQCLFRDDHPTPETLLARSQRKRSILLKHLDDAEDTSSKIKLLKSKKRLMRKAARLFNEKPKSAILYMLDAGLISSTVTPLEMAKFLRNGLVVGLDKRSVGEFLGQAGKSKSELPFESVEFHKNVLEQYCGLFSFEGQSILDGLRMFLATFRLPGEAQQIDRILQAFADRCSRVCEESRQGLFSSDPKRASDAAYLLSFSIIMLNTDRHNANIREDRKMTAEDFVKNNRDYGRDITEKGKEFPPEFLRGIYVSINEEEIRTEGEGADGAMTVERWKDVLRSSTLADDEGAIPTRGDAEDLTELVLEHGWKTVASAVGALWEHNDRNALQGARLGMDLATEMLKGVRQLGRVDIFRKLFCCICDYSGLLGEYTQDTRERTEAFCSSVESQAAFIIAIQTAIEAGEDLDDECWKRVWSMIMELRDLKLLSKGDLLRETDSDFLNAGARSEWLLCIEKGDMEYCSALEKKDKGSSLLGAFGRALFGPVTDDQDEAPADIEEIDPSPHGKETMFVWNEGAGSDVESDDLDDRIEDNGEEAPSTPGAKFENRLVREDINRQLQVEVPVTGLERIEDSPQKKRSKRARVRNRLRSSCDFAALISESRFVDEEAMQSLLRSLVGLVSSVGYQTAPALGYDVGSAPAATMERSSSDVSVSTASITQAPWLVPISPASEAFAEVLLCELALKNKDRLKSVWSEVLQDHYLSRLTALLVNPAEQSSAAKIPVDPGLEKRVTGLLRLCVCAIQRADMASEILSVWKYVLPVNDEQQAISPLRALDRHFGEALWRIVSQVDSLTNLATEGWEGLVSLLSWCARRGGALRPLDPRESTSIAEDDPAVQCYRSIHLLLSTKELADVVPVSIVWSLRCLVAAGGHRNYPQLSVAALDMIGSLCDKKVSKVISNPEASDNFWSSDWREMVEGIAEAAELSGDTVRACGVAGSCFRFLFLITFHCFVCRTFDSTLCPC